MDQQPQTTSPPTRRQIGALLAGVDDLIDLHGHLRVEHTDRDRPLGRRLGGAASSATSRVNMIGRLLGEHDRYAYSDHRRYDDDAPAEYGNEMVRRVRLFADEVSLFWSLRIEHDIEHVFDPRTGETVHWCAEPLSEHRGHGSAKRRA